MNKDEIKLFEKEIKDCYYYEFYLTQLDTGARIGELLALTWEDVNFDLKQININKTIIKIKEKGKNILKVQNKTKTESNTRKIPLTDRNIIILEELKLNGTSDKLVFASKNGSYISPDNIRKSLRNICNKIGIENIGTHVLRHTYATRLYELNVEIKKISKLLGHSKIEHTYNIYTHISEDTKKEAIDELNKNLF